MSGVLSIRIPRELKKKMEELRDLVDWRQEIIAFLRKRVRYYEKLRVLQRINAVLERHPGIPEGFASRSVRGDRDSH